MDEYNEAYDAVWRAIHRALDGVDDDAAAKRLAQDMLLIRVRDRLLCVTVNVEQVHVTPV